MIAVQDNLRDSWAYAPESNIPLSVRGGWLPEYARTTPERSTDALDAAWLAVIESWEDVADDDALRTPEYEAFEAMQWPIVDEHAQKVEEEAERLRIRQEAQALVRDEAEGKTTPQLVVLDRAKLADLPQPCALLDGAFYAGTLAGVAAPGGVGKSAFLLGLAVATSHGLDFLGMKTKQGRTLYIAGEGMRGIDLRIRAWESHLGVDQGSSEIDVIQGTMLTPRSLGTLSGIVADGEYSYVDADTFSTLADVTSENDNREVALWLNRYQEAVLGANADACALFAHHVTVTTDTTGRSRQKMRGASAFRDNPDTVMMLDGTADKFDASTEPGRAGKQKDAAPLTLAGLGLRQIEFNGERHVVVVRQSDAEVLGRVGELERKVALMVPGNGYTSTELQGMWGVKSKGVYETLRTEALELALIRKGDGHHGRYIRV